MWLVFVSSAVSTAENQSRFEPRSFPGHVHRRNHHENHLGFGRASDCQGASTKISAIPNTLNTLLASGSSERTFPWQPKPWIGRENLSTMTWCSYNFCTSSSETIPLKPSPVEVAGHRQKFLCHLWALNKAGNVLKINTIPTHHRDSTGVAASEIISKPWTLLHTSNKFPFD